MLLITAVEEAEYDCVRRRSVMNRKSVGSNVCFARFKISE